MAQSIVFNELACLKHPFFDFYAVCLTSFHYCCLMLYCSDSLPKKSRAKSGSHHDNFVAVDNITDDVLTDFSHVHVNDPNTAESRLSEIIRKNSSRYHSTNS